MTPGRQEPFRPNPFIELRGGTKVDLPVDDRFARAGHLWSQPELDALILALAARRPLLVRGEAGSGKSQIARAAALAMGNAPLLVEVIHPRFEALDLLYHVDVVARLADAQSSRLQASGRKYVRHGVIWRAFKPIGGGSTPVILIDEIDKAESDLPNALLEVLGNRSFASPHAGAKPIKARDGRMPLVVVTTNEERELPAAFVRRCVVLNLNPPLGDEAFVAWLIERAEAHRHLAIDPRVRELAARQVVDDRRDGAAAGYRVGLAEYLDLLTALDELSSRPDVPAGDRGRVQGDWLGRLSVYALVKGADQRQDRLPRSASADAATRDAGA